MEQLGGSMYQVEDSKCHVACSKCFPTGAQYLSGRVDGWLGGWVALEEWKLRLTQPPTKLELELGLSLAI